MFFNLFSAHPSAHLKRAVLMLHEAQMYAERVQRLEAEVYRPQRVEPEDKVVEPVGTEKQAPLYSLDGNRRASLPSAA